MMQTNTEMKMGKRVVRTHMGFELVCWKSLFSCHERCRGGELKDCLICKAIEQYT